MHKRRVGRLCLRRSLRSIKNLSHGLPSPSRTIESLEPRLVLTGTPFDSGDIDQLLIGLNDDASAHDVVGLLDKVQGLGPLDDSLAFTGQSIGERLDPGAVFDAGFVQPLIAEDFSAPDLTTDDLVAFLEGGDVNRTLPSGVNVTVQAAAPEPGDDHLLLDVQFTAVRPVEYMLDLGVPGQDLGLEPVIGSAPRSVAEYGLEFDFQIGLDASDAFFVSISQIRAWAEDGLELAAEQSAPSGGSLAADLELTLVVNEATQVPFALARSDYPDGTGADELASTLNSLLRIPLAQADIRDGIEVVASDGRLAVASTHPAVRSLQLLGAEQLGFESSRVARGPIGNGSESGAEFELGFVGLNVRGGAVGLWASVDVDLGETPEGSIDRDGDGRLDASELGVTASELAPLVTVTGDGVGGALLPVEPQIRELPIDGAPALVVTSEDPFAGSDAVAVKLEALAAVEQLNEDITASISDGLKALGRFGGDLGNLRQQDVGLDVHLPGIDASVGEQLNLSDVFERTLVVPVADYFASTDRPTRQGVVEALQRLSGDLGRGLRVTVDPQVTTSRSPDRIDFDVEYTVERRTDVGLDLGPAVADTGLVLAEDAPVSMTTELQFDARFGVRVMELPSSLEAFFIQVQELALDTQVDDAINVSGGLGLLGVDQISGDLELAGTIAVDLQNGEPVSGSALRSRPAGDLVSLDANVTSRIAQFDVTTRLDDVTSFSAEIELARGGGLFDGAAALEPADFGPLEAFRHASPGAVLGALEQVEQWLNDVIASPSNNVAIPLTADVQLSDVLGFDHPFAESVVSPVRSIIDAGGQDGLFIQDIVDALGASVAGVNYDHARRELTMDINFAAVFEALAADFGLDFDLAGLGQLTTASQIGLTPSIASSMTIGFEMTPLGDGAPLLAPSTPLDILNGGMGVPIDPDEADLEVQLRDGAVFEIDLAGRDTVAGVLEALNQVNPGSLVARIDDDRFGLLLEDRTGAEVSNFRIAGLNGSLAAMSLGIAVTDDDGDGVIRGLALHGDTFSDHVFISEPQISGNVGFSGNVDASANFGLVGVDIVGGSIVDVEGMPSRLGVDVKFSTGAGDTVQRLTLSEIFTALTDIEDSLVARVELSGAVGLALPMSLSGGIGEVAAADARFEVSLDDLSVTSEGLEELADFKDLGFADFFDGLRNALDLVANLETESISGPAGSSHSFDVDLPVLDLNLADAVGFAETLDTFLDHLEQTGAGNLRAVGDVLEHALRTPIDFPDINVTLPNLAVLAAEIDGYVDGLGDGESGNVQDLGPLFESALNLSVELPDLDVDESMFQRFAGDLGAYLVAQERGGVGTLQRVEEFVEDALGILDEGGDPDHDSPLVSLRIDQDPEQGLAVRLDLQLHRELPRQLPLHFDLSQIDLGIVGDLVDAGLDLSGGGTLDLTAGVDAGISVGLDVSDAPRFRPFLYDYSDHGTPSDPSDDTGTRIRVFAGATSEDVHFNAAFGPLGVSISEGIVRVASDSDGSSGAEYLFTQGTAGERRYLVAPDGSETGASITDDLSSDVSAVAFVNLPIDIDGFDIDVDPLAITYDLTTLSDPPQLTSTPDFGAALASIESDGVGSNLLAMVGGWKGVMDLVLDGMRGEVFGVSMPLIGDALREEADFIERVRDSVLANLEDAVNNGIDAVQQAIFDALGPEGGIGFLKDFDDGVVAGDGQITKDDIRVTREGDSPLTPSGVQFDMILGEDLPTIVLPGGFDLGLPGLALDVDGEVRIDMHFDWHVGFGLSRDEGVYFDTSRTAEDPELVVQLEVSTPGLSAAGQLGFLQLDVFDLYDISGIEEDRTRFGATFGVDLVDPGTSELDDRLTISEIAAADVSEILVPDFDATADVNLRVVTSVGGSDLFPQFRADVLVDWTFDSPESSPEGIRFANVQLNLGSFLDGLAGDVLGRVQTVLQPVQPVIQVLTTALPVVSELSGSDVTLVDLARLFGRADVADFAQSVIDVNNLITGLPANAAETWIDFGSFDLDSALARRAGDNSGARRGNPQLEPINLGVPAADPMDQIGDSSPSSGKWVDNLAGSRQGALRFPLIESPFTAFQYLLGNDIDLFVYDAPTLGVDFTYSQFFPVPPIPILGAEIAGRIYATADFQIGFDTTGLRRFGETQAFIDVFDGFFVSDVDESGNDIVEVKLGGSLTAGAKINLLAAEAGVRGGVFANVDFNLHDFIDPATDRADGKIRAGELARSLALGPIHIFDTNGRMDAGLEAFLDVNLLLFEIHETYKLAEVTLLDFEVERPDPENVPQLASLSGNTLTLNLTDENDTFVILPGTTPNGVIVESGGIRSDEFTGVARVFGDAGAGNDIVTINPNVTLPVTLWGGLGDDRLTAGGGPAELRGGAGSDQLTGGPQDDQLFGDDSDEAGGEDFLLGGEGNDLLVGGVQADRLEGGRGDDTLRGGDGNDALIGGRGADRLEGGRDADVLDGGRGDDTLLGGAGDDQIQGGAGDDRIEGGDGDDNLLGGDGFDTIHGDNQDGGIGDDYIEGGPLNDTIFAGAGMDTVLGGTGNDAIDGGAGDDVLRGQGGSDSLTGGPDNDEIFADDDEQPTVEAVHTIDGGDGNDRIFGGIGANTIAGGAGHDTITTFAGDDTIDGGPDDDVVHAGDGRNFVVGGLGHDQLTGGSDQDILWGGMAHLMPEDFDPADAMNFTLPPGYQSAADFRISAYVLPNASTPLVTPAAVNGLSIFGTSGDGDDTLIGLGDTDWLFGGSNRDSLFGGDGPDYLDAGGGDDRNVFGGAGDDVTRGGDGNDVVHGNAGIDQVYGDGGNDELYGDAGTDGSIEGQRLFGGEGDDRLYAWASGNLAVDAALYGDELRGGPGADWLFGNLRRELLFGDEGKDILSGDALDGASYLPNENAALRGAEDLLSGGSGEDQLFGGAENDTLWGGADSDWLEGHDGGDHLAGGSGVDILVLDTDPRFTETGSSLDGHRDNAPPPEAGTTDVPAADDHATDILLIRGTSAHDTILLGENDAGELTVDITSVSNGGAVLSEVSTVAQWRSDDASRTPLVEQFQIAGLEGNDTVEFLQGQGALDVQDLVSRSDDFIARIEGGPGDDQLTGTVGRDRIDGGRGSDLIFGLAGDDRLWGDQGTGKGSSLDHDVIFAGQGNDDAIGGRGTNDLFAWSADPNPAITQLGFVDGQHALRSGDANRAVLVGGSPVRKNGVFTSDAHFSLSVNDEEFQPIHIAEASTRDNRNPTDLVEDINDALQTLPDVRAELANDGSAVHLTADAASMEIRILHYGIYVTPDRTLSSHNGDRDGDGVFDGDPAQPLYPLEDTGLNRLLGMDGDDRLFAGSGLDFMYGGNGQDSLFSRDGRHLESFDAGLGADNGWKEYARNVDRVWYVGGSNVNDVFSVDLVTEPGPLQGRHLVTRLTENDGNFTFAAQLRLDFEATNEDGSPVWNISNPLVDFDALDTENPFERGRALSKRFHDGEPNRLAGLLPPEDDFLAIVIDSLRGRDDITVGPTVRKTVWIDAGPDDDRVQIVSGKPILPDQTEGDVGNDAVGTAHDLSSSAVLVAPRPIPSLLGRLTQDASFGLVIDGRISGQVTVRAAATNGADQGTEPNRSRADLVDDVNAALGKAGLLQHVSATLSGDRLVLSTNSAGVEAELAISVPRNDAANVELGLGTSEGTDPPPNYPVAVGTNVLSRSTEYTGLTIDRPDDVDFFRFQLADTPGPGARIALSSIASSDGMRIELRKDDGSLDGAPLVEETDGAGGIELDDPRLALSAGEPYLLRVTSDRIPTIYNLLLDLGDGQPPVGVDLATPVDFVRRDVVLGGTGNDIIAGGPGEDWIFGGPGNDVLTGGLDRGASDLVFGEQGQDTLQTIPDGLPLLEGTQTTFLPTFSDQFDGGEGDDRVLFLGGDTDREGNPVNDFVALRFNRLLGRYELTSLVWDIANQRFVVGSDIDSFRDSVLDDQPIAYWTLDATPSDAAEDLVSGGTENHGVYDGGVMLAEDGIVGEGIKLSGADDGVVLPENLLGTESGSVALWVKSGDIGSDQILFYGSEFEGGAGFGDANEMHVHFTPEGKIALWITGGESSPAVITTSETYDQNAWHHVTATWDLVTNTLNLYVDGRLAATAGDAVWNNFTFASVMRLGGPSSNANDRDFDGQLDEAAIFNRALTASEISAHFARTPKFQQLYHFYQARNVESTEFETRAGDDVVRGDTSFMFPGTVSEWGISPGDLPAGADIAALTISGGDGNDRLFGGPLDDTLDGGDGDDLLMGGGGNDTIIGGPGGDLLAGGTILEPDEREIVNRDGETAPNDTFPFAVPLGMVDAQTAIRGVNFHDGDPGDWYLLAAPTASRQFGDADRALLTSDMIRVRHVNAAVPDAIDHFLFAAQRSGDELSGDFVPVEQFAGVPDYYLLHVVNRDDLAAREYEIQFDGPVDAEGRPVHALGQTVHVAVKEGPQGTEDPADATYTPGVLGGQPVVLPIGDINGDGPEDFIFSVDDSIAAATPTLAYVHFGSQTQFDPASATADVVLRLPAPVVALSAAGLRSRISAPGDINEDGIDDLAVAVTRVDEGDAPQNVEGVYLLFGDQSLAAEWDLLRDAGAVLKGFDGPIVTGSAGDFNNDETNDLLVGDLSQTYVFNGRTDWDTTTTLFQEDFENGITFGNDPLNHWTRNFELRSDDPDSNWRLTDGQGDLPGHSGTQSLHYGRTNDFVVSDFSKSTIQSPGVVLDADGDFEADYSSAELSFNYLLETEGVDGVDIARISWVWQAIKVGSSIATNFVTNQISDLHNPALPLQFGADRAALADPSRGWQHLRYDLTPFLAHPNNRLPWRLEFFFDPVDAQNNGLPGWYIDDVAITARRSPDSFADLQFPGRALSVAGLGNVNGDVDGFDDMATVTDDQVIVRFGSAGGPSGNWVLTRSDGFTGFRVVAVDDLDEDGHDDFLVTGRDVSYLVFGRDDAPGRNDDIDALVAADPRGAVVFQAGNMQSIGPFNPGDDYMDLAAVEIADTARVDEDGEVSHPRVHIYWGTGDPRGDAAFTIADVAIEPHQPAFADPSLVDGSLPRAGIVSRGLEARLGNETVTGPPIFVEALATDARAYFGQELVPADPDGDNEPPEPPEVVESELFQFDLATPIPRRGSALTPRGISLSDDAASGLAIGDAFAIEGGRQGEMLSGTSAVGDVNGDGFQDYVLEGDQTAYLVLGPIELDRIRSVDAVAAHGIDVGSLGNPAAGNGNVGDDRFDDLVFVRTDGPDTVVSVVFGSDRLPRQLTSQLARDQGGDVGRTGVNLVFPGEMAATAALLNYDGDPFDDLLVATHSGAIIYSGEGLRRGERSSLLDISPDSTDRADVARSFFGLEAVPFIEEATALGARVAGDVNGDGLDDMLFVDEKFLSFEPESGLPSIGRTYLIPGRTTPESLQLGTDATTIYQGVFLNDVFRLDDVNFDGYADFAISRSRENRNDAVGSLLMFFGASADGLLAQAEVQDVSSAADAVFRRSGLDALVPGGALGGPIHVAAGDFNEDGQRDLAVGLPTTARQSATGSEISLRQRGELLVYWSVTEKGRDLILSAQNSAQDGGARPADVVLPGQFESDRLGVLPGSGPIDVNADGTSDLLVGAGGASAIGGGLFAQSGRVHVLYGSPEQHAVPDNGESVVIIETSPLAGGTLVDPESGDVVRRIGTLGNGSSDNSLAEQWYQFTTAGDGLAGDMIRLSPAADSRLLKPGQGELDAILVGGSGDHAGILEFDLSVYADQWGDPHDGLDATLVLDIADSLPRHIARGLDDERSLADGNGSSRVRRVGTAVTVGSQTFFRADEGRHGIELWRTDGTAEGTYLVKDILRGPEGSRPTEMVEFNGQLWFVPADADGGRSVWKSDGTAQGTQRVTQLPARPSQLRVAGSTLFFVMNDREANTGVELWAIDAAGGNARLVEDIKTPTRTDGNQSSSPSQLNDVNGTLYFVVDDSNVPPGETQLWQSGGEEANTQRVAQIQRDAHQLTALGDTLYYFTFVNGREQLRSFFNGGFSSVFDLPENLRATRMERVGQLLYFLVVDGSEVQVWRSDGTAAETRALVDGGFDSGTPTRVAEFNGDVYFGVGSRLYSTDGTTASVVKDLQSELDRLVPLGDQLLITTLDGLWTSDGTADGTLPLQGPAAAPNLALDVTFVETGETVRITPDDIGEVEIPASESVKTALGEHLSALTVRITNADTDDTLSTIRPARHAGTSGNSGLHVALPGVLGDLLDARGHVVAEGRSTIDLRGTQAGLHYLKVYRSESLEPGGELPFVVEINPPSFGAFHDVSDRDTLLAGEGDDRLIGGGSDHLFGESGNDVFVSFAAEVRDVEQDETLPSAPPAGVEAEAVQPPDAQLHFSDPHLAGAIAVALGHPVTVSHRGDPLAATPVFASQLGAISRLDASGWNIQDFSGLEAATSLRNVNLSATQSSLDHIPKELRDLETLALASNGIVAMDASAWTRFPRLRYLDVSGNRITEVDALAGSYLVDDGDAGYTEPGEGHGNLEPVDGTVNGDYRFFVDRDSTDPDTVLAQWSQVGLPAGDYEVQVSWPSGESRSPQVMYDVLDGEQLLDTVDVDQRLSPAGEIFGGAAWHTLGVYPVASGQLAVRLLNTEEGIVAADAVRIISHPPVSVPFETLDLRGNPLGNITRDDIIPMLDGRIANLRVSPDSNLDVPPIIDAIAPQRIITDPQFAPDETFGSYLRFDDSIATLPASLLDQGQSVMIEFRFRTTERTQTAQTLLSAAADDVRTNEFQIELRNDTSVRVIDKEGIKDYTGLPPLTDGDWHHLAVARDYVRDLTWLIVDGDSYGKIVGPNAHNNLDVAPDGLVLGQDQGLVAGNYDTDKAARGELDELRIWDRFWPEPPNSTEGQEEAAIVAHVRANMSRELSGNETELRAYYRFNEQDGNALVDSTGHGFDGTLGNEGDPDLGDQRAQPRRLGRVLDDPVVALSLANQAELDALGIPVFFTADTDVDGVSADIEGHSLTLSAPSGFVGLARIKVTAHTGTPEQPTGRTDQFAFDLHVDRGAIYGNLFHDLNQDGTGRDAPLDGFGVELVSFDPVQVAYDADSYNHGEPIVDATGQATFSHLPSGGQIYASIGSDAGAPAYSPSLEELGFPVWEEDDTLRVDFAAPVSTVTIEATEFSTEGASVQMTAFDEAGSAINVTTEVLDFGFQPVSVARTPQSAIAAVEVVGIKTVSGSNQQVVMGLSNLVATFEVESAPVSTYTDANGDYRFSALPLDRRYEVAPVVPSGWQSSGPRSRVYDATADDTVVNDFDFGIFKPLFAGDDQTVVEGEIISLSVVSDGNPNWRVVRDDGTQLADGDGLEFQFAPPDDGIYTVTVSADSESDTVIVRATNRAPELTAVENQTIDEGEFLVLDPIATFSDPGFGDTEVFQYEIDWGDGSPPERGEAGVDVIGRAGAPTTGSISGTHRYADQGEYLVTVAMADDDGGRSEAHLTVVVTNVVVQLDSVSVSVDAESRVRVGKEVVVSGTLADPGDDFWTGNVDYGDGTTRPLVISPDRTFTSRHVYQTPGRFNVVVSVDDQSQAPATHPLMIEVYVVGDMDRDDMIDFDDIRAFALGLTNAAEYQEQFGAPPSLHGDTDGDGDIDYDDIGGFVGKIRPADPPSVAATAQEVAELPTPAESVFAELDDYVSEKKRALKRQDRGDRTAESSLAGFGGSAHWQQAVDRALDDLPDCRTSPVAACRKPGG